MDIEADAVATLDKRTGEAKPYGKIDEKLFPSEAFDEAIELTAGMPYSARGNIKITVADQTDKNEEAQQAEQSVETVDMIDSDEYKAIVGRYSDEKAKLNYALINKDFIQFAAKSKTVSDMALGKALPTTACSSG